MAQPNFPLSRLIAFILFTVLLIAGCTTPGTVPVQSPMPGTQTISTDVVLTDTPSPSPTPEPLGLVMVANPSLSAVNAADIQGFLEEQAKTEGLAFEVAADPQALDLSAKPRVVVFLDAPENLSAIAASAPDTQFLTFSEGSIEPAANTNVIQVQPAHQAFAAGLIAQMVSPDFRGGGLFPVEDPSLADAFINGGRYLCGRCVPIFAPVVLFPLSANVPASASSTDWQAAFDELDKNRLETLYLPPAAASSELLSYLQQSNIQLIGGQTPPEEFKSAWVATIQFDLLTPLGEVMPQILSGTGQQLKTAPLVLKDINEEVVSPGKMSQIEQVIADLSNGWVYPNSVPVE